MGKAMFMRKGEVHTAPKVLFPIEPTEYELVAKYTEEQTIEITEDGYFEIVLQGASGTGGTASCVNVYSDGWALAAGGGGGGGGCAISRVKLKAGDTIVLSDLTVGETVNAVVNSSIEEYETMAVTSGETGGAGKSGGSSDTDNWATAGTGATGGVGSGGNHANYSGGNGSKGGSHSYIGGSSTRAGGSGGTAGYTGGNVGGTGATAGGRVAGTAVTTKRTSGSPAFLMLYRGNNNSIYA